MSLASRNFDLTAKEKSYKKIYHEAYGTVGQLDLINNAEQMAELVPSAWLDQATRIMPEGPAISLADEGEFGMSIQRHARYFPVGMHTHTTARTWYEMLCVYHGRCPHRIGSDIRILQPGDVVVLAPQSRHSFVCATDDCIIYNLRIREEAFERICQPLLQEENALTMFRQSTNNASDPDAHLLVSMGAYLQENNFLDQLIALWQGRPSYFRQRLYACTQLFLADLLTAYETAADQPAGAELPNTSITEYIRDNIATVTVAEIARQFNYSTRQLNRIFHQTTGINCMAFIQQYRMEYFASRLRSSTEDINTAMEQCGISSSKTFYAKFREKYGTSPAKYRAMYEKA